MLLLLLFVFLLLHIVCLSAGIPVPGDAEDDGDGTHCNTPAIDHPSRAFEGLLRGFSIIKFNERNAAHAVGP